MNWSTIALLFVAWQLLGKKTPTQPKIEDFTSLLNDDTRDILNCVQKLSSKDATGQDKTGAIFQMITNPTVMNFAQNIFGKRQDQTTQKQPQDAPNTNDEGYDFGQPTATSQQFFAPIDNIADVEIKNKLYWFYENWYLAK